MKKLLVVFVAFFAACATNAKESSKNHSSIHQDLLVEVKSAAKEFAVQLDGGNEVMMNKFATDNTFSVTLVNVADGEHTLECINETDNKQVQCLSVKLSKFAKCAYSENKLLLKFSSPVTMADEGCDKSIAYINFVDQHRSVLFEQLNPILTQSMVDVVTNASMQTVTADQECLGADDCRSYWDQLSVAGVVVRPYVNPNECPVEDWVYSSRPFFKQYCDKVASDYPLCFLKDKSGNGVITWEDPKWHFHSRGINLSTTSPRYNGKTCGEMFVDHLATRFNQYSVQGVEFDRADAYCSYVQGMSLKDPTDGHELNYWETDISCRDGYRNMLKYARQIFGKDFIISVRSKGFYFSDLVDGVTFESPFIDDIGVVGSLHPFAILDKYLMMLQKTRFVTFAHCEESQCNENSQVKYSGSNRQESGYAAALLGYNAVYAFDQLGQNGHGSFVEEGKSVYSETGEAVGDAQYPYSIVYDHPEEVKLVDGKSWALPVNLKAGQIIRFVYAIKGTYSKSNLSFPSSGATTGRWVDGAVYQVVQSSEYKFTFQGDGEAVISEIRVFDPTQTATDFMYCRDYQKVKACFNPSTTLTRTIPGTSVSVPPTEGRVVRK